MNTATVTVTGKIDESFVGCLFLADGNFYDVSGVSIDELFADARALAESIGVVIDAFNSEFQQEQ
ncbi:hypothetical protein F9K98_13460 [Brucella anthropi]|uniref:hypothetical protein n=1 Tax=Brucella anthropi TaxID=529 RepID=UPI00124F5170|nr:hypothetical protein [Brucella anthropi]KAB2762792.1 hypothetical protein F9K98_13460 [Brucella anthropi]